MLLVGVVEHGLAGGGDTGAVTGVSIGGGEEPDTGVVVLVVVPLEELFAMVDGVVEGGKAGGPIRPVLQRFEPGLGVGVEAPIDVKSFVG